MDKTTNQILFKTRQHKAILIFKFLRNFLIAGLPIVIAFKIFFSLNLVSTIILGLILGFIFFFWSYFFWSKSYFIVTNKNISLDIRNGLFSNYHMNIYFKNIRDMAYSKNNIIHYFLNCGTFFARSSAGASGDFEAVLLPDIENIYKFVNNIYLLSEEKVDIKLMKNNLNINRKENIEEIIEKEKNVLISIKGIKEAILIEDKDRIFIFENEEDRNHGVYETIRKKIVFVITHDSTFREADEEIVYKKGDKIIFPAIKFHEIKRKSVSSGSPSLKVHNYLKDKFKNLDELDATILIGFDL